MTNAETARFMAQFEASKRNVAGWPTWMRNAATMASASFPQNAPSEINTNNVGKIEDPKG